MSNKRIPNLSVTDGFDFFKKIWGSLPIPSVMNPTTDLDELDKRISDLKAVEQWLNVNLSMLRATIQGLEVQRGTIATIKSFSSNIGLGAERGGDTPPSLNDEFIRKAMQAAVVPPPVPRVEPVATKTPDPEPEPSPSIESTAAAQETSSAIVANATAWWGLLQEQFNKVAAAAVANAEPGEAVSKPKVKRSTSAAKKSLSAAKTTRTTRSRT
jgi:hypothetical protein